MMNTTLIAINAKYIHPNLAVRILKAFCETSSPAEIKEFTIKDSLTHMSQEILKSKPQLAGISCYIWNIEIVRSLVRLLKDEAPDLKILLGGPEVSYDCEQFFREPIDYLIAGEGEIALKQLIEALNNRLPLSEVPQLYYRKDGQIYHNEKVVIADLSTLPSPYRFQEDREYLSSRIAYIESSRGCPYRCSYCLASLDHHLRYFDVNFIKAELRYLMENGAKTFKFLDRTFNARKPFAMAIFEFILREHREGDVFQFEIAGELLDEDVIDYLNEQAPNGLIRFEIGIQSTNGQTNSLVLRKQNTEKLFKIIKMIQAGGKIILHLDLIAGLPKEDYNSFMKTFNDVFALYPDELQLGFLKMLRGTKIRNEAALYEYEYSETAPYEIIRNGVLSVEEIRKIHLAEDMLEKYYNSRKFKSSLPYILKTYFNDNNYRFFENLGFYWHAHKNGSYQYHDLCLILIDFLKESNITDKNIMSLIIYDYLEKQKTRPKVWYEISAVQQLKYEIYPKIAEKQLPYNMDFLYRYCTPVLLSIHPFTYEPGEYLLLKCYGQNDKNGYVFNINGLK